MENPKEKFKRQFEERLINFSISTIRFCRDIRNNRDCWEISDQLIRSATSVGANVVEAKASSSRKDYIKFFEIALKSANETEYWLILAKNIVGDSPELQKLFSEVGEIARVLGSSLLTLKGKK